MSNPIKFGLTLLVVAIAAVVLFNVLGALLGFAFKLAILAALGLVLWGIVSYGAKALSGRNQHRLP
jgi:hypothetical protein